MSRVLLLSALGAFGGALLGAAVMAWQLSPGAVPAVSADRLELERRLEAVEQGLGLLEARVRALPARGASEPTRPVASGPSAAAAPAHPIDTPVFEAAVIDIIERAAEDRDQERAAVKDEKRRQKARRWADELSLRLSLTPAQTERLLEIHADLDDELSRERARDDTPDAPFIPKEERSAARQAAREAADRRLRALLAPNQVATYDALDERLKLYRPKDAD